MQDWNDLFLLTIGTRLTLHSSSSSTESLGSSHCASALAVLLHCEHSAKARILSRWWKSQSWDVFLQAIFVIPWASPYTVFVTLPPNHREASWIMKKHEISDARNPNTSKGMTFEKGAMLFLLLFQMFSSRFCIFLSSWYMFLSVFSVFFDFVVFSSIRYPSC